MSMLLLREVLMMRVEDMSPLEAVTKLYELQRMARESGEQAIDEPDESEVTQRELMAMHLKSALWVCRISGDPTSADMINVASNALVRFMGIPYCTLSHVLIWLHQHDNDTTDWLAFKQFGPKSEATILKLLTQRGLYPVTDEIARMAQETITVDPLGDVIESLHKVGGVLSQATLIMYALRKDIAMITRRDE